MWDAKTAAVCHKVHIKVCLIKVLYGTLRLRISSIIYYPMYGGYVTLQGLVKPVSTLRRNVDVVAREGLCFPSTVLLCFGVLLQSAAGCFAVSSNPTHRK